VTEQSDTSASQPSADGDPQTAPPEQQAAAWVPATQPQPSPPSAAADRPELLVGAAFAGGLLAALILKRLAR
jgi:hypothetical protein